MSDLELLFLVLALIYAWECASWLRTGSAAFTSWFGSRWHQAQAVPMLGNQNGGFVMGAFLPPLGTILTCHPAPLYLSPQGIAASTPAATTKKSIPAHYRFEDIRNVEVEGKNIRVNGQFFVKAQSATLVLHLAARIRELRKLSLAARETALKKMFQESFDAKAIRKRWGSFALRTANLRLLANALFVYLFIFAPLLIWRAGLANCWPSLLVGLYILTFSIAFFFRGAHKHFYPAAADERFTHFLINLFSPATTIRARDVLSRPLLETFHPLAVAKVFCPAAEFERLARSVLLDLRYPRPSAANAGEPARREIEKYSEHRKNAAVEEFLRKSGIKPDELLKPPVPTDNTCLSYCPRCGSQFTSREGECVDCGGLALVPFAPAKNGKATGGD